MAKTLTKKKAKTILREGEVATAASFLLLAPGDAKGVTRELCDYDF